MNWEVKEGDCREVMATIPDSSVDLILTDPPYFKVKGEAWDRQWDKPDQFIEWLREVAEQWFRVLKPNGSLYCFASPRMAARVEVMISERFNVLNSITWAKPCPFSEINKGASNSGRISKDSLRSYYPNTERIIFAEHYGADNIAKGEAGYAAKCDELRGFIFEPLRAYLEAERNRAGYATTGAVDAEWQKMRGTKGCMAGHWFGRSQWELPTRANYEWLRRLFNGQGGEYLRREYEDLRRPFSVSADVPYTDVWTFPTVQHYLGKHPCEKPQQMLRHIIEASSKPGATVLDSFAGTGSTGMACVDTGRNFIGIELDPEYAEIARARIEHETTKAELYA